MEEWVAEHSRTEHERPAEDRQRGHERLQAEVRVRGLVQEQKGKVQPRHAQSPEQEPGKARNA